MSHYSRGEHKPIKTGRAARTRVGTFNSVARRQAVLTAQAARVNAGKTTTADYLRQLGADDAFVTSYSSPYGRTVAKVYRAETGAEPAKNGLAVRGHRLVPVFAYGADDAAILEKAAREYKRTAELVDQHTEAPAEAVQQPATASRTPAQPPRTSATPPAASHAASPAAQPATSAPAPDAPTCALAKAPDVYVRYVVPGIPSDAQELGGVDEVNCQSTLDYIRKTSPTGPGYCTQVALVSDNPGYNAEVSPAKPLKKVIEAVGAGC